MIQRVKVRLIYSYAGILAGGAIIFLLIETISYLSRREFLRPENLTAVFLIVSAVPELFLIVSGFSLIRHEGFCIRNLVGTALGISWAMGNMICFVLARYAPAHLLSRFIVLVGCYCNLLISGILLMAFLAAVHRPAYDKDFVIIPGCSISRQGGLLPLLKGRTNRAIRFAWDQERATGKPTCYIPTGGQGADEVMSEGSAMEFYLLSHGAEQYEVLPEKESTNTYENMLFSKKLIDAAKPGAKACFVTTNYHVLRSGMLARKAGIDAEGLASSTKWYFWPNGLAREMIAIFFMNRYFQPAVIVLCFIITWCRQTS